MVSISNQMSSVTFETQNLFLVMHPSSQKPPPRFSRDVRFLKFSNNEIFSTQNYV